VQPACEKHNVLSGHLIHLKAPHYASLWASRPGRLTDWTDNEQTAIARNLLADLSLSVKFDVSGKNWLPESSKTGLNLELVLSKIDVGGQMFWSSSFKTAQRVTTNAEFSALTGWMVKSVRPQLTPWRALLHVCSNCYSTNNQSMSTRGMLCVQLLLSFC
jgi:hypothetical protein